MKNVKRNPTIVSVEEDGGVFKKVEL